MTKRILWMILPAALLVFSGCDGVDLDFGQNNITVRGSGKVVSEKRDVRGFREVELTGTGELTLEQGGSESLTIEAEDNILPRIKSEVRGDRLVIGIERGYSVRPTAPIRYRLAMQEITGLGLPGSGKIITGPLRCENLRAQLSGSGEIRIGQLSGESLRATISGSGDIRVLGRVNHQDVRVSGSGDYEGKDLESQTTEASISGSGDLSLWVRESLSAHISGSGGIDYYGDPRIAQSISGSGRIHKLGEHP